MTVKVRVQDNGANRAKALLNRPRKKLLVGVLPEQAAQHHSKGVTIGEVAMWMEYGTDDGGKGTPRGPPPSMVVAASPVPLLVRATLV